MGDHEAHPTALTLAGLQALIEVLAAQQYEVLGPRAVDGVIAIRPLSSVDELPTGWADEQGAARYRLHQIGTRSNFGYAVGPQSWKPLLHRPRVNTMTITSGGPAEAFTVTPTAHPKPRRAFLGVRPCELAGIAVQDRVLRDGIAPDPAYEAARSDLVVIAVNCTVPADTCFCTSMGTGPTVPAGVTTHDLELTEVAGEAATDDPTYLVRATSAVGESLLLALADRVALTAADEVTVAAAAAAVDAAVDRMTRRLDPEAARALPLHPTHPQWDDIAERCLSCGNCTAVCPTCFCTSVDDVTDLTGEIAERWQTWDSCFSEEFSRLGGGIVRDTTASRYRQWLTHKLSTWHDQFDSSGCVGCGRCIAWCPVGIDLTEEVPTILDLVDET